MMRINGYSLHSYRLPLAEPLRFGARRQTHRDGILLRLESESGAVGWGDAAPLPGFSRETLGAAQDGLDALRTAVLGRILDPLDVTDPEGSFHRALDEKGLVPSARYAVDLALADLAAQSLGCSLPQALHPDPPVTLPLNGLLMGESEAIVAQAEALAQDGYETLKLKVGRRGLDVDIALVKAVRDRIGPHVALRLDANRAWTTEDARRFAEGIAEIPIAYIEEPLEDPAGLPELWLDTGLPIALDESLAEPSGVELLRGYVAAVVLKPTILGGLAATLRWARKALEVGAKPVLSAAFESGVGLRGVAALAAATGAEAAGLDPYRWLAADVLADPLPFDQPTVDVPALFAAPPLVTLDR